MVNSAADADSSAISKSNNRIFVERVHSENPIFFYRKGKKIEDFPIRLANGKKSILST